MKDEDEEGKHQQTLFINDVYVLYMYDNVIFLTFIRMMMKKLKKEEETKGTSHRKREEKKKSNTKEAFFNSFSSPQAPNDADNNNSKHFD